MTARRHITDCEREAHRLSLEISSLLDALRLGQVVQASDLEHLHRAATAVSYHASRAGFDLQRMPQPEQPERRGLPHSQTINLDAATQSVEKPGEFILDLINDAKEQ